VWSVRSTVQDRFMGLLPGENGPGRCNEIADERSANVRPPRRELGGGRQAELVICDQPIDITYIPTREGWLYLAVVEDLYSRLVVGWAMAARMTSRLVVDALGMAVQRRLPGEDLLAHSDRGSQYASEHYQRLLARSGITCSMSRRGDCWDNAPMESFFASLKTEPTTTGARCRRCRGQYNIFGDRLPVGLAGVGPLLSGVSRSYRRSRTMSDRPTTTPPRA
jgi:transposase InsO family protein